LTLIDVSAINGKRIRVLTHSVGQALGAGLQQGRRFNLQVRISEFRCIFVEVAPAEQADTGTVLDE